MDPKILAARNILTALGPNPLYILVCWNLFAPQIATTNQLIAQIPAYSPPTLRKHLRHLTGLGYAGELEAGSKWILTPQGSGLFPAEKIFSLLVSSNFSELESLNTLNTTTREKNFFPAAAAPNPDTLRALAAAGIGDPKRSQLASREWITPDLVAAVELNTRGDLTQGGGGYYTPGLLIHRLDNWDPSEPPPPPRYRPGNYHPLDCKCPDPVCAKSRYDSDIYS